MTANVTKCEIKFDVKNDVRVPNVRYFLVNYPFNPKVNGK